MPSTQLMQTSFTGGELSPKLEGRTDIVKYGQSVHTMENFIPLPYGGAVRRPGTYYVSEVKDSTKVTRLIPFQFSVTQAYILEFGNLYMRVYKDNGQVVKTLADTDDWVVITDYVVGDYVESSSTVYYCIVAHTSTSSFSADLAAGKWVAQTIYEMVTPYLEADLFDINFTQSADVLFVFHKDYTPNKISRTGHSSWAITAMSVDGGPWMPNNLTNLKMASSTTAAGVATLTASVVAWAAATKYKVGDYVTSGGSEYKCIVAHLSATFATELAANKWVLEDVTVFTSDDVGRLMRMAGTVGEDPDDIQGYLEITAYTNRKVVVANVRRTLSASAATTDWAYGAWSDRTGYPGVGTFYEQRLFVASTNSQPQTVWGSYIGEFENFTTGDKDDEALDYTIYSEQVNAIRWMVAGTTLHIGTQGGGFTLDSGSTSEPLTPTNVIVLRETTYGSSDVSARKIANNVYYMQRDSRRMREISYSFQQDSYIAPDVTIFSDHVTESGIVDMDYDQSPHNLLWCVRDDGQVAIMGREIEQEVLGWCRLVTDGTVESVAVIPNGSEDQVWLLVNRTIDGSAVRYVEYMKTFDWGDDQEDQFFVDCGLTYDSTATTAISGLDHLEGETVAIMTDGAVHPSKVVASGAITLDWSSSVVHVGMAYTPKLVLNRPELGSDPKQSTQGMVKRICNATVRLYKSGSFSIGLEDGDLDLVEFRTSSMNMDEAVPLKTGDVYGKGKFGYNKDSRLEIQQTQPLALHIEAVIMEISANAR